MTATPTVLGDRADGVFVKNVSCNVQPTVTKAATFTGPTFDLGSYGTARLDLHVGVSTGTGDQTLTVKIQTSPDGTNWTDLGTAFTAATTTASDQHKVFAGCDRYLRAVGTIAGTPTISYTYSVTGSAV